MTNYRLRLIRDRIGAGETVSYAGDLNRILYCNWGGVSISGVPAEITCDGAVHTAQSVAVTGSIDGGILWRFELVPERDAPPAEASDAVSSELLIDQPITLESPHGYLIRCDAVNFPLGCEIYEHTHAGPGIRCIHRGQLTLDYCGERHVYKPGDAWFETGSDPVTGKASKETMTGFVRVMILPRTLIGKSSISYSREQDWEKPKKQTYKTYIDNFLEL